MSPSEGEKKRERKKARHVPSLPVLRVTAVDSMKGGIPCASMAVYNTELGILTPLFSAPRHRSARPGKGEVGRGLGRPPSNREINRNRACSRTRPQHHPPLDNRHPPVFEFLSSSTTVVGCSLILHELRTTSVDHHCT